MQKLFIEKFKISDDTLKFLNKYCNDFTNIYYYPGDNKNYYIVTRNSVDIDFDFDCLGLYSISSAYINCYSWCAEVAFKADYTNEIKDTFEKIYDKYKEEVIKHKNKFINIFNDTIAITSGYTKATQYLETFGFVDSINKYLNSIMQSVAKNPLTVVTQDKIEKYNKYLEQRKKDVK